MKSILMCLLVAGLAGCVKNADEVQADKAYSVVKSGDCYSYRHGKWVAPDCPAPEQGILIA